MQDSSFHVPREYAKYIMVKAKGKRLNSSSENSVTLKFNSADRLSSIVIKKNINPFKSENCARGTMREIKLLKTIKHENIVTFIGSYRAAESFYHVTEYAGQNLREVIGEGRYSMDDAKKWTRGLLRAIQCLHSYNEIHGNLGPNNICINSGNNLILTDFGRGRNLALAGFETYLPIASFVERKGVLNEEVDVWSVAALLCEILTGMPLFNNKHDDDLLWSQHASKDITRILCEEIILDRGIGKTDILANHKELEDFLGQFLRVESDHRLSSMNAIFHSFLKEQPRTKKLVAEDEGMVDEELKSNILVEAAAAPVIIPTSTNTRAAEADAIKEREDKMRAEKEVVRSANDRFVMFEWDSAKGERQKVLHRSEELHRAKYEILQRQIETERQAHEKVEELNQESRNQMERVNTFASEAAKKSYDESIKAEKEKMEMTLKTFEMQLKEDVLRQEKAALYRDYKTSIESKDEMTKEEQEKLTAQYHEMVKTNDAALGDLHKERSAEMSTMYAKHDADMKQAHKDYLELQEKIARNEALQRQMETERQVNEMVEELKKTISIQIERVNTFASAAAKRTYDERMKAEKEKMEMTLKTGEMQLREDVLRHEKAALYLDYKTSMENKDKMTKEEQEKLTAQYHEMVKTKDAALGDLHKERRAEMSSIDAKHDADMKQAHKDYLAPQEKTAKNMDALRREETERMLQLLELKNTHIMSLVYRSAIAKTEAFQNQTESLLMKAADEMKPILETRSMLMSDATHNCNLWTEFNERSEGISSIKDRFFSSINSTVNNIDKLFTLIDKSRSLDDKKAPWKDSLKAVRTDASIFQRDLLRELKKETILDEQLEQLHTRCLDLRDAIYDLPDMTIKTPEFLIERIASLLSATSQIRNLVQGMGKEEVDKIAQRLTGNELELFNEIAPEIFLDAPGPSKPVDE